MKVVHVTSSLVRKAAGVREVVLGLAKAQVASGLDVEVLGLEHPDWKVERDEWDGIPTHVVPVFGPRQFGYSPKMTAALMDLRPNLVHLHGLWMHPGRCVMNWQQFTQKPYMISPHGMLSEAALSYGPKKKRVASWLFQNAVLRQAAAFHATSEGETKEVRAYGLKQRIFAVPNGISEISLPQEDAEPGRVILSLGRIHRIKALDNLIMAWKTLEEDFSDWSVEIVGPDEGGEADRLLALISKIGVQRVKIRGPVHNAAKVKLMARAGLFALPTRSENFAITVAESLMLEVPVVSSHGAPWSGLETERCGLWVPFGANAMAEGLRKLLSLNDEERRAMGVRGRAWMLREFSWPSVSQQLSQCYAKVLEASQ